MNSNTPIAAIVQFTFGNSVSLSHFLSSPPVKIEYKDNKYYYYWIGDKLPEYMQPVWSPDGEKIITIGNNGEFLERSCDVGHEYKPDVLCCKYWEQGLLHIIDSLPDSYKRIEDIITEMFDPKTSESKCVSLRVDLFDGKPPKVIQDCVKHVKKRVRAIGGFMYAVQLDGFVKVGFSANVESRMSTYKTSSKIVDLICVEPATIAQELQYHRKYNKGSEKYDSSLRDSIHDSIKSHLS